MFDLNIWQEIGSTIRKNRLRTLLTGFSVAWGIFMLIVLLGAGNGLTHGMQENFADDAVNSIWFNNGTTSKAWMGLKPGRDIVFDNDDLTYIKANFPEVDLISGRFWLPWNNVTVSHNTEYSSYQVLACGSAYAEIENATVTKGRFISDLDDNENRKVAVVGQEVIDKLFKPEEQALGDYIKINNVMFRVVGIYQDNTGWDNKRVYIPMHTAQSLFNGGNRVHNIAITTKIDPKEAPLLEAKIKAYLMHKYKIHPEDKKAIFVWNRLDDYSRTMNVFSSITLFVAIIGIMTIISGVVGVSNIMLITVKERTREFGVRKALGATPGSIVKMVIFEAVIITAIAGYVGLLGGIGLTEAISAVIEQGIQQGPRQPGQATMFRNPTVDITLATGATILLVISGTLAGLIPAMRAAKIRPIEALRDE